MDPNFKSLTRDLQQLICSFTNGDYFLVDILQDLVAIEVRKLEDEPSVMFTDSEYERQRTTTILGLDALKRFRSNIKASSNKSHGGLLDEEDSGGHVSKKAKKGD
jgi:hypothetical protein